MTTKKNQNKQTQKKPNGQENKHCNKIWKDGGKKIKYNAKKKNGNGNENVLLLLFDFNKSTCLFSTDESIWCLLCNYLILSLCRFFLLIRKIPHKQPPVRTADTVTFATELHITTSSVKTYWQVLNFTYSIHYSQLSPFKLRKVLGRFSDAKFVFRLQKWLFGD